MTPRENVVKLELVSLEIIRQTIIKYSSKKKAFKRGKNEDDRPAASTHVVNNHQVINNASTTNESSYNTEDFQYKHAPKRTRLFSDIDLDEGSYDHIHLPESYDYDRAYEERSQIEREQTSRDANYDYNLQVLNSRLQSIEFSLNSINNEFVPRMRDVILNQISTNTNQTENRNTNSGVEQLFLEFRQYVESKFDRYSNEYTMFVAAYNSSNIGIGPMQRLEGLVSSLEDIKNDAEKNQKYMLEAMRSTHKEIKDKDNSQMLAIQDSLKEQRVQAIGDKVHMSNALETRLFEIERNMIGFKETELQSMATLNEILALQASLKSDLMSVAKRPAYASAEQIASQFGRFAPYFISRYNFHLKQSKSDNEAIHQGIVDTANEIERQKQAANDEHTTNQLSFQQSLLTTQQQLLQQFGEAHRGLIYNTTREALAGFSMDTLMPSMNQMFQSHMNINYETRDALSSLSEMIHTTHLALEGAPLQNAYSELRSVGTQLYSFTLFLLPEELKFLQDICDKFQRTELSLEECIRVTETARFLLAQTYQRQLNSIQMNSTQNTNDIQQGIALLHADYTRIVDSTRDTINTVSGDSVNDADSVINLLISQNPALASVNRDLFRQIINQIRTNLHNMNPTRQNRVDNSLSLQANSMALYENNQTNGNIQSIVRLYNQNNDVGVRALASSLVQDSYTPNILMDSLNYLATQNSDIDSGIENLHRQLFRQINNAGLLDRLGELYYEHAEDMGNNSDETKSYFIQRFKRDAASTTRSHILAIKASKDTQARYNPPTPLALTYSTSNNSNPKVIIPGVDTQATSDISLRTFLPGSSGNNVIPSSDTANAYVPQDTTSSSSGPIQTIENGAQLGANTLDAFVPNAVITGPMSSKVNLLIDENKANEVAQTDSVSSYNGRDAYLAAIISQLRGLYDSRAANHIELNSLMQKTQVHGLELSDFEKETFRSINKVISDMINQRDALALPMQDQYMMPQQETQVQRDDEEFSDEMEDYRQGDGIGKHSHSNVKSGFNFYSNVNKLPKLQSSMPKDYNPVGNGIACNICGSGENLMSSNKFEKDIQCEDCIGKRKMSSVNRSSAKHADYVPIENSQHADAYMKQQYYREGQGISVNRLSMFEQSASQYFSNVGNASKQLKSILYWGGDNSAYTTFDSQMFFLCVGLVTHNIEDSAYLNYNLNMASLLFCIHHGIQKCVIDNLLDTINAESLNTYDSISDLLTNNPKLAITFVSKD
jgi:ssDNA-binding Zn-finger/Zn-ribbon topoisomerase 1